MCGYEMNTWGISITIGRGHFEKAVRLAHSPNGTVEISSEVGIRRVHFWQGSEVVWRDSKANESREVGLGQNDTLDSINFSARIMTFKSSSY